MNITFLGATKTVTGSNFLLEGAGKKIIIDWEIKIYVHGHGIFIQKIIMIAILIIVIVILTSI